ncbi:MAG: NAD-dependent epimerase/dehydratase family protein [Bacilli bacterium]
MKKILITGKGSFIGTHVESWLKKNEDKYIINTLDMMDETWKNYSFSGYDVVYHVAGIAHVSSKKKMAPLYFKVNRDLAIEVAKKAKDENVKQFIFMSSMIIYGKDNKVRKYNHIDVEKYAPLNAYGKSKLEADLEIQKLESDNFKVNIIRTPVVYGKGCKGNFPRLVKFALKFPFFLNIKNQKSMIHIDNLCEFVKLLIDNESSGVFYPQNKNYVAIKDLVRLVRKENDKKYRETKIFNWMLVIGSYILPIINQVFGNKTYDLNVSNHFDFKYNVISFEDSIKKSL